MAQRMTALRERWGDRLLTALTLLLFALLFGIAPLMADNVPGVHEFSFLLVGVVAAAVFVVSGRRISLAMFVVALVLAAIAAVFRLMQPSDLDVILKAIAWLLAGLALIWDIGRAVFGPGRVTYHRVMGAILLYLAIGFFFVSVFTLLGATMHQAFTGVAIDDRPNLLSNMIFYSFGVLTGASTGDIAAVHPFAQSLTNLEAMVGQLYPATVLARIVTLQIEEQGRK